MGRYSDRGVGGRVEPWASFLSKERGGGGGREGREGGREGSRE